MLLPTLLSLTLVMVSDAQKLGAKLTRVPSTISNSIVNLGSMDLHIHLSANQDAESLSKKLPLPDPSSFFSKPNTMSEEAECMCKRMKNRMLRDREDLISPSEIMSKIFSSNDLFSPLSSGLCCDQPEQTVIIDQMIDVMPRFPRRDSNKVPMFIPKAHFPVLAPQSKGPFPFEFLLPTASQDKSNTVEFVFLPSKKNSPLAKRPSHMHAVNHQIKKPEGIKRVGDKELRNDFKNMKVTVFGTENKSVKKDLNVQQKLETTTPEGAIETTTPVVTQTTVPTVETNAI